MSCADITVYINDDPEITVNIDGESSGSVLLDQTHHTVTDNSITEYLLKNGQTFKVNSLIVFRNGVFQKVGTHYEELEDRTGIRFLINLDDEEGDEDEITLFYAVE